MDLIASLALMWVGGFLMGWGVHGVILTRRHMKDLRCIREQLVKLRRVD
jgi:hypothetical protein